jgi:nitronate monooxygenase
LLRFAAGSPSKIVRPLARNWSFTPPIRDTRLTFAATIRHEIPVVITTLGITLELTDAVHSYGGLVFHDATTMNHAKKALDANADGIIAVCGGAGGNASTYNPFAFVTELRKIAGGKMIILAGAVSNGQSVAGAIAAGADLVSIGTRFISTQESMAPVEQKTMICESDIDDIIYTAEVSGIGASFLAQKRNRLIIRPRSAERPCGISHVSAQTIDRRMASCHKRTFVRLVNSGVVGSGSDQLFLDIT